MERFGQVGIAIAALGITLAFMGLFPGITGAEPTRGIGIVQVMLWLTGYFLLMLGAIIYVKFTFYLNQSRTLGQDIGVRLALTGLLFAGIFGFADIFGFGSHLRSATSDIFLGQWQAFGILASFTISVIGILMYSMLGQLDQNDHPEN
ncbi:hypothetical protein MASR2M15_27240 [Anaerolineales bacterium]